MMLRSIGVAVFSMCVTAFAHAQGSAAAQDYTPEYDRCIARAGANTVQAGVCAQAELTRQDMRLNRAYTHLMNKYRPGDPKQDDLRAQERKWLKERDTVCKVNGSTVDNNCLLDQTIRRTALLEDLARKQHIEATPNAASGAMGTTPGQH